MIKDKQIDKSNAILESLKKKLGNDEEDIYSNSFLKENKIDIKYQATKPTVTLENVILSPKTKLQIEEGMAKLRFHKIIYEEWNFSLVDKQGRSVILNFFGPPGTGKTLTAEAFAGSINQSIIKVGIAELESKFMGETSKNIQHIFQCAKSTNSVLFFDEADTLLGKRLSSVTQGIDNEVNSMRSTLLIELEKFDGIVIFATNFAKNYDEAFRSRISHHIFFDLPDLENRKAIWNKMIVQEIPLSDTRDELIAIISELSDGFSGREIRTCMRLVLPKALLESEKTGEIPTVKIEHFKEVIEQVNLAKKEVASRRNYTQNSDDINATKSLLGLN